jgi:hypothetical protein
MWGLGRRESMLRVSTRRNNTPSNPKQAVIHDFDDVKYDNQMYRFHEYFLSYSGKQIRSLAGP